MGADCADCSDCADCADCPDCADCSDCADCEVFCIARDSRESAQPSRAAVMAQVCVVLGSVREGRLGLRVARMIVNNLQQLGATAILLDPLEINPPMLQQPLHFMKDYFPPASYRHKPASIASYSMGPYGGLRAAALARPFLAELGLVPLPSTLCIPTVQNSGLAEDGLQVDNERIVKNTDKLCKEVIWYIEALGEKKKKDGNPN